MEARMTMKDLGVYFLVLALSLIVFGGWPARAAADAPKTVDHVDLERYLGDWYEIETIPQRFQKGCVCTRARYTLAAKGKISVYNTCNKNDPAGPLDEAKGTAWVDDKNTNAKLQVSFFWPFRGDYWVIGLAEDYRYAVVSGEKADTLWILSRTPEMAPADLDRAREIAVANGIDLTDVKPTLQKNCVYP